MARKMTKITVEQEQPLPTRAYVLSDKQVRELKRRYAKGDVSQHTLAREYGISQTQVSRIICGDSR